MLIAPSKPSIVWAGTGEGWAIRDADLMGDGVYKSIDSGATWQHMGLEETGRIGRIIVHPTNPNVVYVCALGRTTGEQTEHGVYRTTDGGKTWKLVLTLGGNFGCSGLALDVKNPQVVFAGMWHVILHTYAMYSGTDDPKSGIYVSRDGGDRVVVAVRISDDDDSRPAGAGRVLPEPSRAVSDSFKGDCRRD